MSLNKCNGGCNVIDNLSTKICVPSKTKDINVKVFSMIARVHEFITLIKHISHNCKCKFNSTPCNLNQKLNNDNCQHECKKCHTGKKDYS